MNSKSLYNIHLKTWILKYRIRSCEAERKPKIQYKHSLRETIASVYKWISMI